MMIQQKIRCVFSILLVISVMGTGCQTSNERGVTADETTVSKSETTYNITIKDGVHYLNFSDGNDAENTDTDVGMRSFALSFQSLAEMKDVFLNNKLSNAQIETMKVGFPKNSDGIMIANMNQLYEPVLPVDVTISPDIRLRGPSYSFDLCDTSTESLNAMYGFFSIVPKSTYDSNYAAVLADLEKEHINTVTEMNVADRNATVYEYSTRSGGFQLINYDITAGNKVLHISEHYTVDWYDESFLPDRPISCSIPSRIQIFGCETGQYFEVSIHNISERPSVEWLSSFGLTEYVEASGTVTE